MKFAARGEYSKRILTLFKPASEREPEAAPKPIVPLNECPKCGQRLGRGRYMHIKTCKGNP